MNGRYIHGSETYRIRVRFSQYGGSSKRVENPFSLAHYPGQNASSWRNIGYPEPNLSMGRHEVIMQSDLVDA
jgi:hypothetical protein